MKKSKKKSVIAGVLFGLCFFGGWLVDFIKDDGVSTLVGLVCGCIVLAIYGAIQSYRDEKPVRERAERIKALREQSQQ